MLRDDWIEILPGAEGREVLLAALMSLAKHPGHIRTAGAGAGFIVPPYLAQLYMPAPEAPRPRRRSKKEEGEE